MLTTAIGVSDHIDYRRAMEDVLDQCQTALHGVHPQAGILYTSIMDADFAALLQQVNERFPGLALIGCTTDGEIVAGHGFLEDAVALLLLASEGLHFATAIATDLSTSGEQSLAAAFERCCAALPSEPAFSIILPDGLSTVGVPLSKLIQQATGNRFPIFGGTAGDHYQLETTYQFHGTTVYNDAAPILVCSGNVVLSSQIGIGNEPIGRFYDITRVEGNVLYEIDGRRAADFYETLLGDYFRVHELTQFPLAVYEPDSSDFYLRDPLVIDKQTGTVSCCGTFPERCRVRLTTISREDILRSAHETNEAVLYHHPGEAPPDLVLLFPCTSRRHVLGSKTNDEFSVLLQTRPPVPFFGFYCYGEIGPFTLGGPVFFHSDTTIAVALSERD